LTIASTSVASSAKKYSKISSQWVWPRGSQRSTAKPPGNTSKANVGQNQPNTPNVLSSRGGMTWMFHRGSP
jgi:hypothetical protein